MLSGARTWEVIMMNCYNTSDGHRYNPLATGGVHDDDRFHDRFETEQHAALLSPQTSPIVEGWEQPTNSTAGTIVSTRSIAPCRPSEQHAASRGGGGCRLQEEDWGDARITTQLSSRVTCLFPEASTDADAHPVRPGSTMVGGSSPPISLHGPNSAPSSQHTTSEYYYTRGCQSLTSRQPSSRCSTRAYPSSDFTELSTTPCANHTTRHRRQSFSHHLLHADAQSSSSLENAPRKSVCLNLTAAGVTLVSRSSPRLEDDEVCSDEGENTVRGGGAHSHPLIRSEGSVDEEALDAYIPNSLAARVAAHDRMDDEERRGSLKLLLHSRQGRHNTGINSEGSCYHPLVALPAQHDLLYGDGGNHCAAPSSCGGMRKSEELTGCFEHLAVQRSPSHTVYKKLDFDDHEEDGYASASCYYDPASDCLENTMVYHAELHHVKWVSRQLHAKHLSGSNGARFRPARQQPPVYRSRPQYQMATTTVNTTHPQTSGLTLLRDRKRLLAADDEAQEEAHSACHSSSMARAQPLLLREVEDPNTFYSFTNPPPMHGCGMPNVQAAAAAAVPRQAGGGWCASFSAHSAVEPKSKRSRREKG